MKDSQISQLNIKDKLIDMEKDKEKNTDLEMLSMHFPNTSNKSDEKKTKKKNKKRI